MNVVIVEEEKIQKILETLIEIKTCGLLKKDDGFQFVDNENFLSLLGISKRTAQSWRDEGVISFSQINGKIYYRLSDIDEMLKKHYKKAFKKPKYQ